MGMADAAMSALYFGQKKTKGGGWMAVAVAGIITSRSRGEPLLKQMRPKSNVSQKNAKKAPDCLVIMQKNLFRSSVRVWDREGALWV